MLVALETLFADPATRKLVVDGITAGGSAAGRLTHIQQTGLMKDYDEEGKGKARGQLLGGLWGSEATLLTISGAVKKAYQLAEAHNRPLKVRWIPGVTAVEILPVVELGDEAVYLVLLTPRLKAAQVMEKAAYDPKLLDHLRQNASHVVAFFDSI
jgi:hypothetical protein